jgi:hypothetical protein
MIQYNKEYFYNNYYFLLKEGYNKITLYYSVADTLTEARKKDKKIEFDKKDVKKVGSFIDKILKSKSKPNSKIVDKKFKDIKDKSEIDELVDSDGTMMGSNIPIINQKLSPRKTMDQTVVNARISNDPVTRGYRVYWGESEDEQDNIVSEIDMEGAFGYEETKDKDFEGTVKTLKKMGVDDPIGRAEEMGKDPKLEKKKTKGSFIRQRLSEKETIEEIQRREMVKMVEDIVTKKNKDKSDVVNKESNKSISQFLIKNLKSIKSLAEKEGVSLNELIKALKYNE